MFVGERQVLREWVLLHQRDAGTESVHYLHYYQPRVASVPEGLVYLPDSLRVCREDHRDCRRHRPPGDRTCPQWLSVVLISYSTFNLHNQDGQDAHPTRFLSTTLVQSRCGAAYYERPLEIIRNSFVSKIGASACFFGNPRTHYRLPIAFFDLSVSRHAQPQWSVFFDWNEFALDILPEIDLPEVSCDASAWV